MSAIEAFEAQNRFDSLLDRAERVEEIIITRHGKPVARPVPNSRRIDQLQAQAAVERIRMRAEQMKPFQFDWETLKTDRNHGRP